MTLDLILRNARLTSTGPDQPTVDIGVQHGRIVAIEPLLAAEGPAYDAGGKLVSPGGSVLDVEITILDKQSTGVPLDEQAKDDVRHLDRFREADRLTDQTFDPCA